MSFPYKKIFITFQVQQRSHKSISNEFKILVCSINIKLFCIHLKLSSNLPRSNDTTSSLPMYYTSHSTAICILRDPILCFCILLPAKPLPLFEHKFSTVHQVVNWHLSQNETETRRANSRNLCVGGFFFKFFNFNQPQFRLETQKIDFFPRMSGGSFVFGQEHKTQRPRLRCKKNRSRSKVSYSEACLVSKENL